MRISIGNTIALTDISLTTKQWFIDNLTFENPKYKEALDHGRSVRFIEKNISMFTSTPNGIVVPRGMLQTIEGGLLGKGYDIELSDTRVLLEPVDVKSAITLRPYQLPAKKGLLKHPNGVLVAPAGSGKTILGLEVFASLRQRMLWLTHTTRLAQQVKERILGTKDIPPALLNINEKEIGMIGNGKWKIGDKITIALVQTLVRRLDMLPELGREFGLVIVDEVHHLPATTFTKVIQYFYSYYLYGLTATLRRRDKLEGIVNVSIGNPNAIIPREEVKKDGGIITPTVRVKYLTGLIYEGNDYNVALRDFILPNESRSDLITEDIIREAKAGNHCVIISTRKEYCEILYQKISRYWAKCGISTGDYNDTHNTEQLNRLESNSINVLITTFDLLGEGFDVKKLNRCFLVLPMREGVRIEQAVGRIQRSCDGKDTAIVYDYVDTNVGILSNQFRYRCEVYNRLGMKLYDH